MEKRTLAIFAVSCNLFLSTSLFAQQQRVDTARTYYIPEITVSDIHQTREVRSTAPLQIFSKDALKNLNALQVSDAVKHFAGVTVKDYGGIGGLKTISIRSLGAQHTAVGYDGITLTDCQTGQIDLGRFSLDNVDQLSLSNGQSDNIFQPARFFASAGILNIQTLTPRFEDGKHTNISASFKTGSWGLVNPSLLLEQRISRKWTVSANGEWMSSDGHYPYTLYYGNEEGDLSSREKRKNTGCTDISCRSRALRKLFRQRTMEAKSLLFPIFPRIAQCHNFLLYSFFTTSLGQEHIYSKSI